MSPQTTRFVSMRCADKFVSYVRDGAAAAIVWLDGRSHEIAKLFALNCFALHCLHDKDDFLDSCIWTRHYKLNPLTIEYVRIFFS